MASKTIAAVKRRRAPSPGISSCEMRILRASFPHTPPPSAPRAKPAIELGPT